MNKSKTGATRLKKHKKLGKPWHEETSAVFDEAAKSVIGRVNENGEFVEFDSKCLEICTEHGFKFDPALVTADSEDDEEEIEGESCLLYTSPSPRDGLLSRMPSSA